jgi:hypothetical protein
MPELLQPRKSTASACPELGAGMAVILTGHLWAPDPACYLSGAEIGVAEASQGDGKKNL